MSNSSLVNMTMLSPNHSGRRNQPITKIAIHHTAGAISAATIGNIFRPTSRQASCNYGIGNDNKIVLCVDESNRSWCTSSSWCDNRAVTIEVSNSSNGGNWPVSDRVLATLIDLVTDICKRNGIKNCTYTGGKDGVLQKHEWYAATNCPGPYLGSKFSYIASEVNKRLSGNILSSGGASTSSLYRVRKSWSDAKSQKGAFRSFDNAKKCANSNSGYKVYDSNGNEVYPNKSTSSKSIDTLAREVIAGNWGNGGDRVNRLRAAGYDYDAVQNRVNEILSGKSSSQLCGKSIDTLAREVIRGDWGNGQDRKNRLERAGYFLKFLINTVRFDLLPRLPNRRTKEKSFRNGGGKMKHKLLISVSKEPKADGYANCKAIKLRERLIRFFLGKKSDIMVFIPSNRIDEISIQNEGGER